MRRMGWRPWHQLLLFGLGNDLTPSHFYAGVCVVSGRNPWQAAAAGVIFVAVFLYLVSAVRQEPLGRGTGAASSSVLR